MMDFETSVISVALFALLAPAVAFDVQKNKIPNLLVFPFWLLSPLLYLSLSGLSGLGMSLAGLGVAFAISLPFWLLKWVGAGDVKLIAAVGALLGWPLALPMLAAVGISGAFLALSVLAVKGALGRTFERYNASLAITLSQKKVMYIEAQGEDSKIRLPYAIAISTGTLVVWLNNLNFINLW